MLTQGFSEPILARSGNGTHVQFPLDLPNDDDPTKLVKPILQAVDAKFTDASVTIDTGVFNAARICRLYGTVARKGDSIPSRPHRLSELLYVPSHLKGESSHDA